MNFEYWNGCKNKVSLSAKLLLCSARVICLSERMSSDPDPDVVEGGLNKRQIVCLRKGIVSILPSLLFY